MRLFPNAPKAKVQKISDSAVIYTYNFRDNKKPILGNAENVSLYTP